MCQDPETTVYDSEFFGPFGGFDGYPGVQYTKQGLGLGLGAWNAQDFLIHPGSLR